VQGTGRESRIELNEETRDAGLVTFPRRRPSRRGRRLVAERGPDLIKYSSSRLYFAASWQRGPRDSGQVARGGNFYPSSATADRLAEEHARRAAA